MRIQRRLVERGAAATCIRAGWTMGKVKDVYMRYVTSGNQFVGRCLCLLSVLWSDFTVYPAHFVSDSFAWIASARNLQFPMIRLIAAYEKNLNMCLASIMFHRDWLLETLPVNHAFLMSSHVHRCTSFGDRKETVHLTYPWSDINNAFSGVPPHISLLQEVIFIRDQQQRMVGDFVSQLITFIRDQQQRMVGDFVSQLKDVLEQMGVDGGRMSEMNHRSILR